MPRPGRPGRLVLWLLSVLPLLTLPAPGASQASRSVALTFDDVPATLPGGGCSVDRIEAITEGLLSTLRRFDAPATGFVVASRACGDAPSTTLRRTLDAWVGAGHMLGNHSATHPDLNSSALDRYLADVDEGAAVLEGYTAGQPARYFRPPYLHLGPTEAKRTGLLTHLADHGVDLAPVTMDNQEWVYNQAYIRAVESGDQPLADRVVEAYVEHMDEVFAYYERLSDRVFGRQVPQVLLLHANTINGDHLDRVLHRLVQRGYDFVDLHHALGDPAYASRDAYVGERGLSWLQRWAITAGVDVPPEPREHAWLQSR